MEPERGIDHVVHCVRDLDQAAAFYERLGFTLTPRASHPWGTDNRLVQFKDTFLEILTVAAPERIVEPAPDGFEFGAYNRDYLRAREGMSMLALKGADAAADARSFAEHGLSPRPPFHFERRARLPDGGEATVAFDLAFAMDAGMPEAVFFTCQQSAPEHFWKPAFQSHENGASAVADVVMIGSASPAMLRFMRGVFDADRVSETAGGLTVEAGGGTVTVLSRTAFEDRFPGRAPERAPNRPHFAAYRIAVKDLGLTKDLLDGTGVPSQWHGETIQVGAQDLFGVALEFSEAA